MTNNGSPLVVEFAGGLGNQLFQYVFGVYLHHQTGRPLYFDTTAVIRDSKRSLLVTQFHVSDYVNTRTIISTRRALFSLLGARIRTSLNRWERLIDGIKSYQDPHNVDSIILLDDDALFSTYLKDNAESYARYLVHACNADMSKPVYVRGYWQNYFFYEQVKETIARTLVFENPHALLSNKKIRDISEQIQTQILKEHYTCSIHVRRGDYLEPSLHQSIPILPIEYYQWAVCTIKEHYPQAHWYVFSDDADWCKTKLQLPTEFTVVSDNITHTAIEDLYVMCQCSFHILANSSFSWWSSMLPRVRVHNSESEETFPSHRHTIAPRTWFAHKVRNAHIHSPSWTCYPRVP